MPTPRHIRRRRSFFAISAIAIGIAVMVANIPKTSVWRGELARKPAIVRAEKPPYTAQPSWPDHVAAAAVGVQGHGVLAAHGDSKPRPIASIAKTITSLAILEKHPLKPGEQGPNIPITSRDEERYHSYIAQNGSVAYVQAGTSITERQAIEAMMLPSANNVSDTAAVWAFGSMTEYHKYANKMLDRLGLHDTVVGGDASGLSPKTKSTASDLVKLGEIALQNPALADIVSKKQTSSLPASGPLPNYNRLVTDYGYNGVKIGDSNEAGITLLFSTPHTIDGKTITLVGVVLGAQSQFAPSAHAYKFMESVKQTLAPNK